MTADYGARSVLVDVLVYHWRTNSSGCGCGWSVLGASHAEHVADVFFDSLLARRVPPPPNDGSVIDWRRINREQAEQGLPDDLRDEEGSSLPPDDGSEGAS